MPKALIFMLKLCLAVGGGHFSPLVRSRAAIVLSRALKARGVCSVASTTVGTPAEGKSRSALDEIDKDGRFVRTPSLFRDKISSEPGARFPPAKGRYHLYIRFDSSK
eukprot:864230-Amorphochlora_amoeboformis.AAC.1